MPGSEPDLAGYRVYRSSTSAGPYQPIGPFLDRPAFLDTTAPSGTAVYYVVRAVDTSGNLSAPVPVQTDSAPVNPASLDPRSVYRARFQLAFDVAP